MTKSFCDACGVELTAKTKSDIFDPYAVDFDFIQGVFCKKCEPRASQLKIEYRQQAELLKQSFRDKLKGGEK